MVGKCKPGQKIVDCRNCTDCIPKDSPEAIEYLKKLNELGKDKDE